MKRYLFRLSYFRSRSHPQTRMDNQHVEINPHFLDAEDVTPQQREYIPSTLLPGRRGHDHQRSRPPPSSGPLERQPQPQHQGPQPPGPSSPEQYHESPVPLQVGVPGHHPIPLKTREQRPPSAPSLPRGRRTKPLTWFGAAFCIIFWFTVIIGGLVILIVYLAFRPRSPRFEVSSVTLNAAYLEMGYLLNADLTLLANFTNPNKKVSVDFSYMYLDLFFENSQIATQYIEPFSAARGQSRFENIHMVTSQVRLSVKETMLLQKQIENNRVMFTVKGRFRARSNFGNVWRYSYWLHGQCSIMVSSPPTGVLKDKKCKTRH